MPKRKFARIAALVTTVVATVRAHRRRGRRDRRLLHRQPGGGAVDATREPSPSRSPAARAAPRRSTSTHLHARRGRRPHTVNVQNTGTGNEDIYLVFDNTNVGWSAVNDLGQYGKFTIDGTIYDNLNNSVRAGHRPASRAGHLRPTPCERLLQRPASSAINFLPHTSRSACGTDPDGQTARSTSPSASTPA